MSNWQGRPTSKNVVDLRDDMYEAQRLYSSLMPEEYVKISNELLWSEYKGSNTSIAAAIKGAKASGQSVDDAVGALVANAKYLSRLSTPERLAIPNWGNAIISIQKEKHDEIKDAFREAHRGMNLDSTPRSKEILKKVLPQYLQLHLGLSGLAANDLATLYIDYGHWQKMKPEDQ